MAVKQKIISKNRHFVPAILLSSLLFLADLFISFDSNIYKNQKQFFGLWGNNYLAIVLSLSFLVLFSLLVKSKRDSIGYVLVLGGAAANILDRIFLGGVPDYLRFLNIPTFNFSDICVVIGVCWLAIEISGEKLRK